MYNFCNCITECWMLSKELFQQLNYRGISYDDLDDYGEYRIDYYAINSLSYPKAEYDGENVIVSYVYTYVTRPYGNRTYPDFGSIGIPVKVTLKKTDGKYSVVNVWEKP